MSQPSDTRFTVLRLIADAPEPITSTAIRAHQSLRDEDTVRIRNIMYNVKKDGLVEKNAEGGHSITAKGRAALASSGNGGSMKVKRGSRPNPLTMPRKKLDLSDRGVVEATLQKCVEANQGALDVYLSSVGDPNVFGPLKRARDDAAIALEHFRNNAKR